MWVEICEHKNAVFIIMIIMLFYLYKNIFKSCFNITVINHSQYFSQVRRTREKKASKRLRQTAQARAMKYVVYECFV